MKSYRVTWGIDLDANNPQHAARHALEIQRDPFSTATVFAVYEPVSGMTVHPIEYIDLVEGILDL